MNKEAILQETYNSAFKDELEKISEYHNIDNELEKNALNAANVGKFITGIFRNRSGTVLKRGKRVFDRKVRDASVNLNQLNTSSNQAYKELIPSIQRNKSLTSMADRLGKESIFERQNLITGSSADFVRSVAKKARTDKLSKVQAQMEGSGKELIQNRWNVRKSNRAVNAEKVRIQPQLDEATAAYGKAQTQAGWMSAGNTAAKIGLGGTALYGGSKIYNAMKPKQQSYGQQSYGQQSYYRPQNYAQ